VTYSPPEIPVEAQKIAKKFFERAQTVAETRNYDYAIELYLQGLDKNPQDVEAGHKQLREVAIKRKLTGGKKVGILETLKRSTSGKKDSTHGMLNAEYFLAKDPFNVSYAEAMVKGADKAELPDALKWALDVLLELARQEKKVNAGRLLTIKNLYEKLGDHYDKCDKPNLAIECYQGGVAALEAGIQSSEGRNLDFASIQRDLAGKLTILRGKYERADSFRDSIQNADAQKELQDKGRAVKGETMYENLIQKAREELKVNPDVAGKINALVDLLLQRGKPRDEDEAIEILQSNFDRTGQYSFKMRADDIRIRKLNRDVHAIKAKLAGKETDPKAQAEFQQAVKKLQDLELSVFKDRVTQYPTDSKIKFEYGMRLYKSKQYDEAIPMFQESMGDPRVAVKAKFYIGICFFQKGWHQQAADILNQAIEGYEAEGDSLSKEMHYYLGRAYEKAGRNDDALKAYNKLIQWDFNYRDVRQRSDQMQK